MIEELLVKIGARERDEGLGKKIHAVRSKLPARTYEDLKMIIETRNEAAHGAKVYFTDARTELYFKKAKNVQAELIRLMKTKDLISSELTTLRTNFTESRGMKKLMIGAAIAALLVGGAMAKGRFKK